MAVTRLIAMHINKVHTVTEFLKARTDYAVNPEKTELGIIISADITQANGENLP